MFRSLALVTVLLAAMSSEARADWINFTGAETAPTIAEITISEARVHVALEIYFKDLKGFQDVAADRKFKASISDRVDIATRVKAFSEKTFNILIDNGQPLKVNVLKAEPRLRKDRQSLFAGIINPITRQRVPDAPKDKRVLYVELEYALVGRPEQLTIVPPLDAAGRAKITIGFIAFHNTVPIIDFRYLSGPATLNLDWDDPWYTRFENPNLKRHHKSPMMSAVYVEPREVRHEVMLRVRDLKNWIELGLNDDLVITPEEQGRVKSRASAFLSNRNPVRIDDTAIEPINARAEFITISPTGVEILTNDKDLDRSTAIIGVILSYPTTKLPQRVTIRWDLFNARITQVPATMIDAAGPLLTRVDSDDPVIEWRNHLVKYEEQIVQPVDTLPGTAFPIPIASILLLFGALLSVALGLRAGPARRRLAFTIAIIGLGSAALAHRSAIVDVVLPAFGPPSKSKAAHIVGGILNNIRASFLERDARNRRVKLAEFVTPDTVDDVERELRRALMINVVGGGRAQIDAIETIIATNITSLKEVQGFRALVSWAARLRAGHWGHVHRQKVEFRALTELAFQNGVWSIAGLTIVDAKRVR